MVERLILSAIIDLYDHSIVSLELGRANNNTLVINTVKKAMRKNLGFKPLLYSDRGFQPPLMTVEHLNEIYVYQKYVPSRSVVWIINQPNTFGIHLKKRYFMKKTKTIKILMN